MNTRFSAHIVVLTLYTRYARCASYVSHLARLTILTLAHLRGRRNLIMRTEGTFRRRPAGRKRASRTDITSQQIVVAATKRLPRAT